MRPRKLRLPSGTWRYIIKECITTLWTPAGRRYQVPHNKTFKNSMCSCGPEYSCLGWGFSPHALRAFIEKHLSEHC